MIYPCLTETAAGTVVILQVQPRSSKNQVVALQEQRLKIKLTAPPVDGAANKRCCEYLADFFGLPKGRVELLAGERARAKRVLLHGYPIREAQARLEEHFAGGS